MVALARMPAASPEKVGGVSLVVRVLSLASLK